MPAAAALNRELIEVHMSSGRTYASASAFPRRVRFVLVNGCSPRADAECVLCGIKIEKAYVGEAQARLLYSDTHCFVGHAIAIKNQAKKESAMKCSNPDCSRGIGLVTTGQTG